MGSGRISPKLGMIDRQSNQTVKGNETMSSVAVENRESARPRQNWVLSPTGDLLLIILAPILSLIWAVITFEWLGAAAVWAIFGVFNVAHHLPTFIRIYGDNDLMRRFRWRLILAPLIPFTLALGTFGYLLFRMEFELTRNLAILFIILTVWDPWHFLMQHYGFMRIYDRHNRAPIKLSSWMDYVVFATWFVYIMVAVLDWFPSLLYDLKVIHGLPVLFLFDAGTYPMIQNTLLALAVAASVVYVGYLVWCYSRGYFVSHAKLLLLLVTVGVMYLTYVPNPAIDYFVPGWTFRLGFATLGMVHVTQYLAIVWKYNRSLSQRDNHARSGAFETLFARGGLLIGSVYVLICLAYGWVLIYGSAVSHQWPDVIMKMVIGTLLAVQFTSTFLHYYYDGFIWKVRHKENRENLAMTEGDSPASRESTSWWNRTSVASVMRTFSRQFLYFAIPMFFVLGTWWVTQQKKSEGPLKQAGRAYQLRQDGHIEESRKLAGVAIDQLEQQLELESEMIEIRPQAKHYVYAAELIYAISLTKNEIDLGQGQTVDPDSAHGRAIRETIVTLEQALELPGPFKHPERSEADREQVETMLTERRREVGS